MQESRPLVGSAMDLVWLRRSRLLNNCLLVVGLAFAIVAGTGIGVQLGEGSLNLSTLQVVVLIGAAAWLIVAYVFSRRRRLQLAGGMVVALLIVALALATYLAPAYAVPLLPLATLPIALAALLLGWRAIYLTTAATILALAGAGMADQLLPPPPLGMALPPPDLILSFTIAVLALFLLALILAPLRGEIARLLAQIQRAEHAQIQADQRCRVAEQAREEGLASLAWQRNHIDLILQRIGDGVLAIDGAGKVVRANAAARALWAEIAGGELLDRPFDQVCEALAGQSAATAHVAIAEIGDTVPEHAEGYTHILFDRREQARLARLRGELLALLADEMRNPLTSMVTALEMTLGQNLPDGADRVLVGARRSGQRLLELVTTLLEINQIEQNPRALRREATPLRPILETGIAQTAPLAQQGAVTVVVEYSGDGTILLDGERVRRAFVYLLENALRHSPPYSTVQVRIERQNGLVVVRISDQGAGLTAQQREVLFDQRALPAERSAPALGLAFSKLVIETHGGRVWVESSGSQGSTYAFSLPIAQ